MLGRLEDVSYRLQGNSIKQKVDALLDAFEYGQEGIELVVNTLSDRTREVRQSAFLLLCDSNEDIARQAIWNYLPFAKMQCLHTLTEFNLNCYNHEQHHPEYFAIADFNNTLVCYWDLTYKSSCVNVWNLETGQQTKNFVLSNAHEFGLGKEGRVCVVNFQHLLWVLDIETQKHIGTYPDYLMSVVAPHPRCFTVCPRKQPLVVAGFSIGWAGEIEIWDYETYTRRLHYQFHDLALVPHGQSWHSSEIERLRNYASPFLFTPDGNFLVARFQQKKHSILQLWDLETAALIQTLDNLPLLALNALAICPDGKILACGMREDKMCVWELTSDRISYASSDLESSPCIMSRDGRVLICCTDNYEIIVLDLVTNKKLQTFEGHTAPVVYLAMSSDREFIASYSIDKSIKIWGIPKPVT